MTAHSLLVLAGHDVRAQLWVMSDALRNAGDLDELRHLSPIDAAGVRSHVTWTLGYLAAAGELGFGPGARAWGERTGHVYRRCAEMYVDAMRLAAGLES